MNELTIIEQALNTKISNSDKWVNIYVASQKPFWPKITKEDATYVLQKEMFAFLRNVEDKGFQDCTSLSAEDVFMSVISSGLSFTNNEHVYLIAKSINTKKKDNQQKDIYERRLFFKKQDDGEIFLAQRAKSIEAITSPVMVFEGDEFAPGTNDKGEMTIYHKPKFPRASNAKVIAAYLFLDHPNKRSEPIWMTVGEDIPRLILASQKQNGNWSYGPNNQKIFNLGDANPLYFSYRGGIDPEFFATKLRHKALKGKRLSNTSAPSFSPSEIGEDENIDASVIKEKNKYHPETSDIKPQEENTDASPYNDNIFNDYRGFEESKTEKNEEELPFKNTF